MNVQKFLICFISFGLIATLSAFGQDYQQLRKAILQQQAQTRSEINDIDAQINQYNQRLTSTNQKYEKIYTQYEKLKRLLALQEQKIASLQKERDQIHKEIDVTTGKLDQQQEKLKKLVEDYKKTLRYLYKNGRTSQLALILSSESMNQMLIRNYYLKKFQTYREKQANEIKQTQNDLEESKKQLAVAADHNKKVLSEIEVEKKNLAEKTSQQQTNVNLLRQDKEQIQNKLTEVRQQKEQLNNTLSQLITREEKVRENEKRRMQQNQAQNSENENSEAAGEPTNSPSEAERTTKYVGRTGYLSDEALSKLESSFGALKGDLPWPVASHTVSEHFGRHRNPVYGTLTPNLGIEIVTKPDAAVHVIHGGYVFAVQPITGYGDVVFVSHGKYKTAYGNLSQVVVRKNTILKEGDMVGYAGDDNSIRGASVFFMLRAGSQNLDPENWLKDK